MIFVRPATLTEFMGLPLLAADAECGAAYVVIGDMGDLWDYRTLNRAFRLLHSNPKAKMIALGMTRYWMAADGIALDVAPFVVALEHASGRKALVFGKPSAAFLQAASERLGLPTSQILMVGDDIETEWWCTGSWSEGRARKDRKIPRGGPWQGDPAGRSFRFDCRLATLVERSALTAEFHIVSHHVHAGSFPPSQALNVIHQFHKLLFVKEAEYEVARSDK